jgi:hypothetical protein
MNFTDEELPKKTFEFHATSGKENLPELELLDP